MATLRNKKKAAAISRETHEKTRNNHSQNTLDPEKAREYISQVSEEIEGRVTKKLSKEFSRTESRILGALSKLDEFLLNPQFRTCSVAVPGASRNSNSENGNPLGIVPWRIPFPKRDSLLITLAIKIAQRGRLSSQMVVVCAQIRSESGITPYSPQHCSTA